MPRSRPSRKPLRWLALLVTMIATAATVAVQSPASAGTSYFPAVKVSTGSGQGVNVKAGVYVYNLDNFAWTKTYATSYGSPNHRVDFALVVDGIAQVRYHHPNVGTGTWEDCLQGTNSNCAGYISTRVPAYLQVTVSNLSNGTCRKAVLSSAAMNTHRQWGNVVAC